MLTASVIGYISVVMTTKPRSAGQTAVSVSLPAELLSQIDARAKRLGLNRSQYLSVLARRDLDERGDLTLREQPLDYKTKSPKSKDRP